MILILDTCVDEAQIALYQEGVIPFSKTLPFSQELLPEIQAGLSYLALTPKDLKAIFVTTGPGSYTGMRMGAIIAKTLSFAHKTPLVGLNTLFGLVPQNDGPFASLIDARMGGAYITLGIKRGSLIEYTFAPALLSIEKVISLLQETNRTLVTPHAKRLKDRLGENTWVFQENPCNLSHLAELGREKLDSGAFTIDGSLQLSYFRS